ncbi:NAD(P)-binding protein [Aaosphaeria arxii CBS 175.79]|uniref:NAD(P)-binding protein n=1 Tax=Aaosphaeria arxii CBS 175.79 TaxID=1450172 RepID=A0A6A5Y4R1_9PLEO|nr:NAD(P)-binding protein [Aaosphaeria arxii CBS 175.79]KAF2020542.1 NAD(P)-binding protein [Aaosphaeria arxii CBS 175.79]
MPLTVLSDADVRTLLYSLKKEDILDIQQSLADALHYYSTATENDQNGCCSTYQPLRTKLKRPDGQTTLVMPASSNEGFGVKLVTLAGPDAPSTFSKPSRTDSSSTGSALPSLDSLSLSSENTISTASSTNPVARTESLESSQSTTPRGSLTLLDKNGSTRALINAEEITAFRTALASTMLFNKRHNVHDLLVFGAGRQAYWHIRLALLLRGPEIHHLNIVNRSYMTAHNLIESLYAPHDSPASFPQINIFANETHLARPKISILTPQAQEYDRLLKNTVRQSAAIFCTTPSVEPLFPAAYLTNTEGRKKGRYIAAIGSYKPHMLELHPDILKQNVQPEHGHHFHKHAKTGGAIIVDSVEACLKEAGEIIKAGITGDQVVEIGELIMLRRDAEQRRREGGEGIDSDSTGSGVELGEVKKGKGAMGQEEKQNHSIADWLHKGNVIYKSVGLGLMDVVVGSQLVRLADERGIGTRIDNF